MNRITKLAVVLLSVGFCVGLAGCSSESRIIVKDGQTVAFLGDSITAGGASYGKYCRLVVHGLKTKGIFVDPVLAGVSGNTSEDMLGRLDESVLRHKPDWMLLAAGVNDIWHGDPTVKIGVFQPKPGMGVKLEAYKKNVTEIVDRCSRVNAKVMLTTITPIREDPEFKLNITARKYNEFLARLARNRNLPIARLNEAMFAEIARGTRLTSDGVHPLDSGHRVMAEGILRAMGLNDKEIDAVKREWSSSANVLILGDRQTSSGSRMGGWCHLLMDGMNSAREMVTYRSVAGYRTPMTVEKLLAAFREKLEDKPRYVILQAPKGDAELVTPLDKYRRQVAELIDLANQNKVLPILVTIAVQNNDPASELSLKLEPYNNALRSVAGARHVPLADIHQAMKRLHAADPGVRLTYDGERFNRQGSILLTELLMHAMGIDSRINPKLRKIWTERPSYTKRYKKPKPSARQ
ncbi:MAG: hypothetical protein HN350_03675 [Phycisphaerales bacterium]|jgi:lysophospholipase L1-like esterase|nr:hypothetical protein [Phycisphaerales bacterium]